MPVNRPLEGEEDSLLGPLEMDIEPVAAVGGMGEQSAPSHLGNARENGVGGVGLRLIGKVDPGHAPVQHPAGEHRYGYVWGLERFTRSRHSPGLDGHDLE